MISFIVTLDFLSCFCTFQDGNGWGYRALWLTFRTMLLTSNNSRSVTSIFKSKDLADDYTSYAYDDLQLVLKCTLILGRLRGRRESVAFLSSFLLMSRLQLHVVLTGVWVFSFIVLLPLKCVFWMLESWCGRDWAEMVLILLTSWNTGKQVCLWITMYF